MTPREKANECLRKWRLTPKGLISVATGNADKKAKRKLKRDGQSFNSGSVQETLMRWGGI